MPLLVRSAGVYQTLDFNATYVKVNGVWVQAEEAMIRDGGQYKQSWRSDGPPPPPTSLSIAAINGGRIDVGWAYQANDEGDYNQVEVQNPGNTARYGTGYPATTQVRSLGYAHGSGVSLEARTVDNGGQASGWVPVPYTTALNALPPAANFSNFYWDGSQFVFVWDDPANPYGDAGNIQLWYRRDDEGPWTLGAQHGYAGAGGRAWGVPNRAYDNLHHAFVRTFNNAGYTDTGVRSAWAPPPPGTEKTIAALVGDSWGYNAGDYRYDGTVRQGQFSPTPYGNHFGMFFYGANSLWNLTHGHTPIGGDIFLIRDGTQGFTGNVTLHGHGYGSMPGPTPGSNGLAWMSISQYAGADASGWENIPPAVLSSIAAGSTQGIGMYVDSTAQANYRVFKGPNLNGFAGAIRLRW